MMMGEGGRGEGTLPLYSSVNAASSTTCVWGVGERGMVGEGGRGGRARGSHPQHRPSWTKSRCAGSRGASRPFAQRLPTRRTVARAKTKLIVKKCAVIINLNFDVISRCYKRG